jgi:hypothetical protein
LPADFLRQLFRSALLSLCVGASTAVLASCPAGQQEICLGSCLCAPAAAGEIGPLYDGIRQMAATGLQQWIVQSRSSVAEGSIQRIPLHIRAQLEPYYDLQVLDTARYKVGDDGELSAANTMLQNPDVNAVTLMDLIVFRNAADAENNVALWAHELKHVQQYLQWGVQDFAARYTRDYSTVEKPAYEIQGQVTRALKSAHAVK